MGEVIKYGCIADAALFDKLEQGQVIDHLEETICRCVLCKKHFVEEDTNDKGRRMILNFGHTFGHALEKLTGFGKRHRCAYPPRAGKLWHAHRVRI